MEALDYIERAYDRFSTDSEVNYQILSFVGDRMADPDTQVRNRAVQFLDSKLSWSGKLRPDPTRIKLTDREAVKRQLQHDIAANEEHSVQASRLLKLLNEIK